VADSLRRRDGLSVPLGVALWERYCRAILRNAVGMPVLFNHYDELIADPIAWAESVRSFMVDLGISVTPEVDGEATSRYVDSELRHFRNTLARLNATFPGAAYLYEKMLEIQGSFRNLNALNLFDEPAVVE